MLLDNSFENSLEKTAEVLGYFSEKYPDELLYSQFARFIESMNFPSPKSLVKLLFGKDSFSITIDFPTNLKIFLNSIPPGIFTSVDEIIDGHTLLPFYQPFLEVDTVLSMQEAMKKNSGGGIYPRSGAIARPVPLPKTFHFCPVCEQEDKEQKGESYWHRLHNLPGVKVCPTHKVWLESTDIPISAGSRPGDRHGSISAQRAIRTVTPRLIDPHSLVHVELLKIAADAAWLLSNPQTVGLQVLRNKYKTAFIENGYASYSGRIRLREIIAAFLEYYPTELLQILNCELENSASGNWLTRLIQRTDAPSSPALHLLLIHFFGYTIESFLALPEELKPFGDGPWSCLNPVCENYRKPVIETCQIEYKGSGSGRPHGTFACECGFIYNRLGPDNSTWDANFRLSIIEYGAKWEQALCDSWNTPGLSLCKIAERLGVSRTAVKSHAERLKLSFSRPDGRQVQYRTKPLKPIMSEAELIEKHRVLWLQILEKYPHFEFSKLLPEELKVFEWLERHNRTWLNENKPSRQRYIASSIDWEERDQEYCDSIQKAVTQLKQAEGRPLRITLESISRVLGINSPNIRSQLNKLPLTAALLESVYETPEMYAERRIDWAVKQYKKERICPKRRQLLIKAGIGEKMASNESIKHKLETAIVLLSNDN